MFKGLITIIAVILCFAGSRSKFALQFRLSRITIWAGDNFLGVFQANQEIFRITARFFRRSNSVLL